MDDWKKAWELAFLIENGKIDEAFSSTVVYEADDIPDVCPTCEDSRILKLESSGHRLVCSVCGLVVENFTDEKPEWNIGNADKGQNGTDTTRGEAINPLMPHASMNTEIVATGKMQYRFLTLKFFL